VGGKNQEKKAPVAPSPGVSVERKKEEHGYAKEEAGD